MPSNLIIPSNPKDIQKLKQMVGEATNAMARIDSENELKKEIIEEIVEQFELPKKMVTKMITVAHKANYSEVSGDAEDFGDLYESVMEAKDNTDNDTEDES